MEVQGGQVGEGHQVEVQGGQVGQGHQVEVQGGQVGEGHQGEVQGGQVWEQVMLQEEEGLAGVQVGQVLELLGEDLQGEGHQGDRGDLVWLHV